MIFLFLIICIIIIGSEFYESKIEEWRKLAEILTEHGKLIKYFWLLRNSFNLSLIVQLLPITQLIKIKIHNGYIILG